MLPDSSTSFGYCHCGCGGKTKLARQTRRDRGNVKGEPVRFLRGHQNGKPDIAEWLHSQLVPSGECLVWTGAINVQRYGIITVRRKHWRTHRLAWTLKHGPIPDGFDVLHTCDNPPCMRDEHLFLGTQLDNARDMVTKQRHAHGERHGNRTHPERRPRGERCWNARLTEADVLAIRIAYAAGDVSQTTLARQYGVGCCTISRIVRGHKWAHSFTGCPQPACPTSPAPRAPGGTGVGTLAAAPCGREAAAAVAMSAG